MRIRTGPDFQIQCILYGKWQNPDCAVRIAVKRPLKYRSVFEVMVFSEPVSIDGAMSSVACGRNDERLDCVG